VYIDAQSDPNDLRDTQIVGMIFAVQTEAPYLAFVTPIDEILKHIKTRFDKTVRFAKQNTEKQ
jgi:hypothetical protein